jgi:hypothetical protein
MFIYLKANSFNDLFYVLREILNLAICCYNILVMEFLGCYSNRLLGRNRQYEARGYQTGPKDGMPTPPART